MTSPRQPGYATPAAIRRAIADKLRNHADPRGRWSLIDLQRQFAYDCLLDRLYRIDSGWIVKGATALLARDIAVRHTIDIDVFRAGAVAQAERDVHAAIEIDAGDGMRFEIGRSRTVMAGIGSGVRLPVKAFIGAALWTAFHVDLVVTGYA